MYSNDIKSIQAAMTGYSIAFEAATVNTGLSRGELLKLRGPAIFLDRISGNNRKYVPESVHQQVQLLQPRIAAKSLFGELDHPPVDDLARLAYVQMQNISHRIDALWWDDKLKAYMLEATVLDTPNGRILKTVCDAGSPLYVSLRSLLDPARNKQKDGYVDAWMLALITIDFVSQPGFSDAVLEPIATANESMQAVCEALNMTNFINNNKRMRKSNKQMYSIVASENITGVPVEASSTVTELANRLVADIKSKFTSGFSEEDFNSEYNGLFEGYPLGLYGITGKIALTKLDEQTTVVFDISKLSDNDFELPDSIDFEYYDSESSPSFSATEMYKVLEPAAVIATENWTPTDDFIKTSEDILTYMRTKHKDGFDMTKFQTIADAVKDNYDADVTLSKLDSLDCMCITKDGAKATIGLNVSGTIANVDSINEYAAIAPLTDNPDADADKVNSQTQMNQQMYQIVDVLQTEDTHKGGDAEDKSKADTGSVSKSVAEIAEEAARIFGMPSNRFAGNFAIEHMPVAYKHLWQGMSETGKLIIAKRAEQLGIATESQTIQFFAKLDWTGIERAVVFSKNAEAAVESYGKIEVNKCKLFLDKFVPRR